MNVLITGGAGFIGHRIANLLEKINLNVTVVDCAYNYSRIPETEFRTLLDYRLSTFKNTKFLSAHIQNKDHLESIFKVCEPDIVIHCASPSRQKAFITDIAYSSRTLTEGLLNTLNSSIITNVKKFVYISSSMVYGDFADYVLETDVCTPINEYGILKYAGEQLVRSYTQRHNLSHVIVRPSAVYGPNDYSDRVINRFFTAALNNETLFVNGPRERLDFSYIDDVAEGIVKASLCNVKNETYNITKGESFTLYEAAKMIIDIVGSGSIELVSKDKNIPSRGALSILKARRDLGYSPNVSIWQGLKLQYDWLCNSSLWSTAAV